MLRLKVGKRLLFVIIYVISKWTRFVLKIFPSVCSLNGVCNIYLLVSTLSECHCMKSKKLSWILKNITCVVYQKTQNTFILCIFHVRKFWRGKNRRNIHIMSLSLQIRLPVVRWLLVCLSVRPSVRLTVNSSTETLVQF